MKIRLKTLSKWSFSLIKIPHDFAAHPPKPEKIIDKMLRFNRESELEDILVDENMVLLDGYCSYLIALQVGAEYVKIKQVKGC